MKSLLLVSAVAGVFFVATRAEAQEVFIGAVVSVAGADTTNETTAVPFKIPLSIKLTVWCNASGYVITNTRTAASATNSLPVSASTLFPTYSGSVVAQLATAAQGGALVRVFGTAAVTCYWFGRTGKE